METPHQSLVAAVQRALNAADRIRLIAMGAPEDEYSPEINSILPKLAAGESAYDVTNVLYLEFVRYFDYQIAGPREAYDGRAGDLDRSSRISPQG